MTYGIQVADKDDANINRAERLIHAVHELLVPGKFLVDVFPMMKHIPSWFPGATFRKKATMWKTYMRDMLDSPYQDVKTALVSRRTGNVMQQAVLFSYHHFVQDKGQARPSIASTAISQMEPSNANENDMKWVCAEAYVGATFCITSFDLYSLVIQPALILYGVCPFMS